MILSAHQPAYLPWMGYLHRIAISDHFVILDEVQFEKNSFTNRNRINASGKALWLTVPVHLKGHLSTTIADIEIAQNIKWSSKHYKSLCQAYQKSPFFSQHKNFFESVYQQHWSSLLDLNQMLLKYLLEQFTISTPIKMLSDLNVQGKKQELILNLCQELSAKAFIFGVQGGDYVDEALFADSGIDTLFHHYSTPVYQPFNSDFIPDLSCVDLLFNYPVDELSQRLFEGVDALK
ncbi:MAG: Uncharacterised protein [Cellvibrionales bacterium UBA7375]|nr:MAG: Uncharacterised protein [Cellvibrionales bacterium UBA7375]